PYIADLSESNVAVHCDLGPCSIVCRSCSPAGLGPHRPPWVEQMTPKLTSAAEISEEDAYGHIDIFHFEYV
uniref:Uncharacterized protein n=1 Tax=Romanomermis culicivorax TaxID=13658 RepID=A0A915JZ35_ROMCU